MTRRLVVARCSCSSASWRACVLANRMRERPRPSRRRRRRAVRQSATPGPVPAGGDAARLHPHRRTHRPGRRQHLLAAGRAPAGADRPVLRIALRRPRRIFGSRRGVESSLGLGRRRQHRRVHPHEQSRRHRRGAARHASSSSTSPSPSPTSARCAPTSSASIRRPTWRC